MKKIILIFWIGCCSDSVASAQLGTYLMKPDYSYQGAYIVDTVYYTGNYIDNCGVDNLHLKHGDSIIWCDGFAIASYDTIGLRFVIPSTADTGKWDLIFVYGIECWDSATWPGLFTVLPASAAKVSPSNDSLALSVVSNPSDRTVTALVNAPFSAPATMELYDGLGHIVKTVPSPHLQMGDNQFTLGCSALPAGNYYLRLSASGTVKTVNVTIEH